MQLVANWRRVLRHAWSIRLIVFAMLLSAAEVAMPLLQPFLPIPPGAFAALAALTTAGALWARIAAQKSINGEPK